MATISMWCPQCQSPLYFEESQIGSVQHCPACKQAVIVPPAQRGVVATAPNMMRVTGPHAAGAATASANAMQERSVEQHQARKVNMGSGCFAMLAVMFAVAIMGAGIGALFELDPRKLYAVSAMVAGLGGLIAFVFFGYIATETASASSSRGREHR